jgi:hypothetical protein
MPKVGTAAASPLAAKIHSSEGMRAKAAGALAIAAALCLFLAVLSPRFLGVTSNWFSYYGQEIRRGQIPYRDFYLYLPPLLPLKMALIDGLFGDVWLYSRLWAAFERLVLGLLLYAWMLRVFRVRDAALATLLAMAAFFGDSADAMPLHHFDAVLFGVAGAFAAASASDERPDRWRFALLSLSGVLCGLSFLTKQTNGAAITIAVFGVMAMRTFERYTARKAAMRLAAFAGGWVLPVAAVSVWLAWNRALSACIDQVFRSGFLSKGSPATVLTRPFLGPFYSAWSMQEAGAAMLLIGFFAVSRRAGFPDSYVGDRRIALPIAAMLGGVALACVLPWFLGPFAIHPRLFSSMRVLLYSAFFATVALFINGIWRRLRRPLSCRESDLWLMAAVSAANAYALGLSFSLYAPMAVPALAVTAGLALTTFHGPGLKAIMSAVTVLACVAAASCGIYLRLMMPFSWKGWTEPAVSAQRCRAELAPLRGLSLSEDTGRFLLHATEIIQEHTVPGDEIFVYPYYPILYSLSGRRPATFAPVHFIDVTPDAIAREDAARIKTKRPRLILLQSVTDEEMHAEELYYRGGRPSGQRDLLAVVRALTGEAYTRIETLHMPGSGMPVHIYVRR